MSSLAASPRAHTLKGSLTLGSEKESANASCLQKHEQLALIPNFKRASRKIFHITQRKIFH